MPLVRPNIVVTQCKTAGRCGSGQTKAIFLSEINRSVEEFLNDARNCCATSRGCLSSVHYALDPVGLKVYQLVPEMDTAWGFDFDSALLPNCNPCPPDAAGCDPCKLPITDPIFIGEVGDLNTVDPNCFAVHIALLMPVGQTERIPQTDLSQSPDPNACPLQNRITSEAYDLLVKLLCDVFGRTGLAKTTATLRKFFCTLSDLDIAQLLIDITTCPAVPSPFNRICHDLSGFPTGTVATVFGVNAQGICVKGAVIGGAVETPLTANDSTSIDFTTSGVSNHTLTGVVKVSVQSGNQLVVNGDGLFVPLPSGAFDICASIAALGTGDSSVPSTATVVYRRADGTCGRAILPLSGGGGGGFITAQNGLTSPSAGIVELGGSLLHNTTVTGTSQTMQFIFTNSGNNTNASETSFAGGWAEVANDTSANNRGNLTITSALGEVRAQNLTTGATGFITTLINVVTVQQSITGGNTVRSLYDQTRGRFEFVTSGGGDRAVRLDVDGNNGRLVKLQSSTSTNYTYVNVDDTRVTLFTGGLLGNPHFVRMSGYPQTRNDSGVITPINFLYTDTAGDVQSAPLSFLTPTTLVVNDSSTVDLTASGTAGHTLTAAVKISATAGNTVTANADGIYVASGAISAAALCTAIAGLGTTDTEVPVNATIPYRRIDGTCGRAVFPISPSGTITSGSNGLHATGASITLGGTLNENPTTIVVPNGFILNINDAISGTPTGEFHINFEKLFLDRYPNTRDDIGVAVNVLGTTGTGQLVSNKASDVYNGFEFTMGSASTTAVVSHSLSKSSPMVVCYDVAAADMIIPQNVHIDSNNQVTVTFAVAVTARIRVM